MITCMGAQLTMPSYRATSLILAFALLEASCQSTASRPCDPFLEALIPPLSALPSGTGLGNPDRGISAESRAHPTAVCGTTGSIPGGGVAVINLYQFQDPTAAKHGYDNLVETAQWANPDFYTPIIPNAIAVANLSPDDIWNGCFSSIVDGDSRCRVVARYADFVYWLSLSHLEDAGLTEADLPPIMSAMENNIISSRQRP